MGTQQHYTIRKFKFLSFFSLNHRYDHDWKQTNQLQDAVCDNKDQSHPGTYE